jgi:hypothetical protein
VSQIRVLCKEKFKNYIHAYEMKTDYLSKQELFPARRGPFRIARYEDADRLANVARAGP